MKRLILCLLLVFCLTLSAAHAEVRIIFDQEFFLTTGIWSDENQFNPQTFRSVASGDSVWTVLYRDNDIWRWDTDTGNYTFITKVPMAEMTEKSLSRLSASEQAYQLTSVTDLIGADGKLYGFNALSGRLGLIDEEGVHWNEATLDTAPALKPGVGYPSAHFCPTIVGDKLYMLCDLTLTLGGNGYQPALVSCNLDGSDCTGEAYSGLLALCRYDDSHLLLLTMTGLEIYNTETAQSTPLSIALPATVPTSGDIWDIHSTLGGLAYDPARDVIYLATPTALYASIGGGEFIARETGLDWGHALPILHTAAVLTDGTYVFYADGLDTYIVHP